MLALQISPKIESLHGYGLGLHKTLHMDRNWLVQKTATNRIISSQGLIIIRSKRDTLIDNNKILLIRNRSNYISFSPQIAYKLIYNSQSEQTQINSALSRS